MIKLDWKDFNVDLQTIDATIKDITSTYCGNQSHSHLELWFTEEPSEIEKEAINKYWNSLTNKKIEAKKYKSTQDIKTEKETLRASGLAKLKKIGLTDEEVAALIS